MIVDIFCYSPGAEKIIAASDSCDTIFLLKFVAYVLAI